MGKPHLRNDRLDANSRCRERLLKLSVDLIRIYPQKNWNPLALAERMYRFVQNDLKADKIEIYEDLL